MYWVRSDFRHCRIANDEKTTHIFPYVVEFGLGYAWKPAVAEISAGDRIRFQWTSPPFVTSNQFQVMEVATQDGEYDGTGFHSGPASATGRYTYKLIVELVECLWIVSHFIITKLFDQIISAQLHVRMKLGKQIAFTVQSHRDNLRTFRSYRDYFGFDNGLVWCRYSELYIS